MIEFFKKIVGKIAGALNLPNDKLMHFGVNFVFALTAFINVGFGIGLCLGASFGKEYGDSKASGNSWSWEDIIADMLGMTVGLSVVFLVRYLVGR